MNTGIAAIAHGQTREHARWRTCCVTNIAFDTRVIEFSVRSSHEPSERVVVSRLIPAECFPTKRTDRVVDERVERAYSRVSLGGLERSFTSLPGRQCILHRAASYYQSAATFYFPWLLTRRGELKKPSIEPIRFAAARRTDEEFSSLCLLCSSGRLARTLARHRRGRGRSSSTPKPLGQRDAIMIFSKKPVGLISSPGCQSELFLRQVRRRPLL